MYNTKKPSKQRKRRFESPKHRRQKMVTSLLSPELRDEFGRRSMPLRSGDEVRVMRGDFKGEESKVKDVDLKNLKVTLEDVKSEKVDGTEYNPKLAPSNLMIIDPDIQDRKREKIVERSGGEVKEEYKEADEEEIEEEVETEESAEEEMTEEEDESGFKCEICGEVYDSKQGLNVHKGKKHPEYNK